MLAAFLSLPRFLYAIVDIFAARVGEQYSSVVGLARLWRIQLFDFRLAVLQQFGGNFRCEFHLAFLKEAVIFPHYKIAFPIRAIIVLPTLKNGFTATGTFADDGLFLFEKALVPVRKERIGFHKPACYVLDSAHKVVSGGVALGNLRQTVFPFCCQLGACQHIGENAHKVVAVLGRNQLLSFALNKSRTNQFFNDGGACGGRTQSLALGISGGALVARTFHSQQ